MADGAVIEEGHPNILLQNPASEFSKYVSENQSNQWAVLMVMQWPFGRPVFSVTKLRFGRVKCRTPWKPVLRCKTFLNQGLEMPCPSLNRSERNHRRVEWDPNRIWVTSDNNYVLWTRNNLKKCDIYKLCMDHKQMKSVVPYPWMFTMMRHTQSFELY